MATLADRLARLSQDGPVLAVLHDASDTATPGAVPWARVAGLSAPPCAWPDEGAFQTVLLPLPRDRAALQLCLAACAARLAPGGTLYVHGPNAYGIKSVLPVLRLWFAEAELADMGGHGRIYAVRGPLRRDATLADLRTVQTMTLAGTPVPFASYPGLFAKGKLDDASALLIGALPEIAAGTTVLDLACGLGVLARAAQLRQPALQIMLADHDPLALLAAGQNVPGGQVRCVADPADVIGRYDLILSNPPIHEGGALSHRIAEALVVALPDLLTPNGHALIVAQRTVPLGRWSAERKLAATEVAASKSFTVVKITA